MLKRQILACLLAACLAFPASLTATPGAVVVGIATTSEDATLQRVNLHAGATVFSGDTIGVGDEGSAVISLSSDSMLRFGADTVARLLKTDTSSHVAVELSSGHLAYRASSAAPLEVRVADAVVRNAGKAPVRAAVAYLSPDKVVVGTEEGAVTVSTARNGRSVTVRPGESVEVTLAEPPQAQQPAGRTGAMSGKRVALIGAVVIAAITLTLLIRNAGVDRPQDLVSPFRLP